MATNGYIRLHRKSLDSGFMKNHKRWAFWCWCLLKATHTTHTVTVGSQKIELKPGQFIFGRKQASIELGIPESTIYRFQKSLESETMLGVKPNNKFSVFSIVNWVTYQHCEDVNEQQMNNKRTTNEQQMNTNKKGSKGKKGLPFLSSAPDEVAIIVEYLNQKVGTHYRDTTPKTVGVIKSRLIDGYSVNDFKRVIDIKTTEWSGGNYAKYLRPETLFGNKFDEYLNQPIAARQNGGLVY